MASPKLTVVGIDEIKIDKGVAEPRRQGGCVRFYPYDEMEIGDSFLAPTDIKANSSYGIAREGNRRAILLGKPDRFRARKMENGFRIFRIA